MTPRLGLIMLWALLIYIMLISAQDSNNSKMVTIDPRDGMLITISNEHIFLLQAMNIFMSSQKKKKKNVWNIEHKVLAFQHLAHVYVTTTTYYILNLDKLSILDIKHNDNCFCSLNSISRGFWFIIYPFPPSLAFGYCTSNQGSKSSVISSCISIFSELLLTCSFEFGGAEWGTFESFICEPSKASLENLVFSWVGIDPIYFSMPVWLPSPHGEKTTINEPRTSLKWQLHSPHCTWT